MTHDAVGRHEGGERSFALIRSSKLGTADLIARGEPARPQSAGGGGDLDDRRGHTKCFIAETEACEAREQ